jgi:two-component system, NarL family, nitrate/nitrite response regulator NarL
VTALRVMIVDDHPLVRTAVAAAIAKGNMTMVAEATSGEEAIERAPEVAPDILLVDLALPGLSGLSVVRELAPRMPATAIVILSTSAAERDVMSAMRYGARGYLTKDLAAEALVRALHGTQTGELVMNRRLAQRLIDQASWRGHGDGSATSDGLAELTARERDVLRLIADGLGDRDIAVALTISRRTAETHVSSILHKLGVGNRAEAARRYREGS